MFEDINFRYTDAQQEKIYAPELIEKAFVDIDNILEEIKRSDKFLVVGPKGAGKSALSSKLKTLANPKWNFFVSEDKLEQFEFNLLLKTGAEKNTSIGGSIASWEMLLAIRMFPLLLKDEEMKEKNKKLEIFHNKLKEYGLASSDSLIQIVRYTSRRGVFSKIKAVLALVSAEKIDEETFKVKDPAAIVEAIKCVLQTLEKTESKYYLIIDGLDHPIRNGRNNIKEIADLLTATKNLNTFFIKNHIFAKVVILIRDEVLLLVPDPNLAKTINDNGITLKWYDNTREPLQTSLFQVFEKRAALAGEKKTAEKLWNAWFPKSIHKRSSVNFVLDNTRYLPRDLISFFRELQKIKKEPPFTRDNVLVALNNYSDWFLRELSDALVGLVDENLRTEMPGILSSLGRRFSFEEFSIKIKSKSGKDNSEIEIIARELFRTSWIGNVWETTQGSNRYAWQHRKGNVFYNPNYEIVVHPGLLKALNLI